MSEAPAARPDPWRGLRGIFAGTLIMEAIVTGLAVAVVARLGGGLGSVGAWYVIALAVAMVVAAGVQRRPWGLGLALLLQAALIAGAFAHPSIGAMGVIFALVWAYLLYLRARLARHLAAAE